MHTTLIQPAELKALLQSGAIVRVFDVSFDLMRPEGGSFTPYANLTQEQVLGWCWAGGVDKAAIESGIQTQIDGQINPPVVQPPLPWAAPQA